MSEIDSVDNNEFSEGPHHVPQRVEGRINGVKDIDKYTFAITVPGTYYLSLYAGSMLDKDLSDDSRKASCTLKCSERQYSDFDIQIPEVDFLNVTSERSKGQCQLVTIFWKSESHFFLVKLRDSQAKKYNYSNSIEKNTRQKYRIWIRIIC